MQNAEKKSLRSPLTSDPSRYLRMWEEGKGLVKLGKAPDGRKSIVAGGGGYKAVMTLGGWSHAEEEIMGLQLAAEAASRSSG